MLSLQMMLLVSCGWSARQFEQRIEHRMHGFIFISALVFASVPLFFQAYNPNCGFCLVATLPYGCSNGTTECLRGSATIKKVYTGTMIFLVSAITVFSTTAMIIIYRTVYRQEQTMAQYQRGPFYRETHARSRNVRTKMLLYTSTFYISWILPTIFIYIPDSPLALAMVGCVLHPLMGFLNMLVFLLPKCAKHRKESPGTGLLAAYCHVLIAAPISTLWRRTMSRTSNETPAAGPSLWTVDADIDIEPRDRHGSGAGFAEEAATGATGGEGDAPAEEVALLAEETSD